MPCLLVLTRKRSLPQAGAGTLRQLKCGKRSGWKDGSPARSRPCAGEGVRAPGSTAPKEDPETGAPVLPTWRS